MDNNDIWKKYENGKDYLNRINLVNRTNRNWDFYSGNQWRGLESGNEELPKLNFIKPTVRYKVATIAQSNLVAVFSDTTGDPIMTDTCKMLTKRFAQNWEHAKMDSNAWRILRSAAVQGDSYLYFGSSDVGENEILLNTQIIFGNEQEREVQRQPWIILSRRRRVEEIKEDAERNNAENIDLIVGDEDQTYEVGNRIEMRGDGKTTDLVYMTKKDGIVHIAKCTKGCYYEPLHPIGATTKTGEIAVGAKLYPIVSLIWEEKPNSARGTSEVEQLIPNQIEVNKTLARRSISVKMTAFPRIAYDATAIQNAEDLEKVGVAIGLNAGAGNIDTMIKYLNPASMSHDAKSLLDDLLTDTRDLAGAGDAALGNVDPSRASGTAITAVRDQQALPLNEQESAFKQFAEDLAKVWLDMDIIYRPNGFEVVTDVDGTQVTGYIAGEILRSMTPTVKIDVSKDNGWTKYAEQQVLDNHLAAGHITFEEYVELVPDGSPFPKNKMKSILERRQNVPMQEMQGDISENGGGASGIPEAQPLMP